MTCWTRCRLSSQNIPKLTSAHWASHQATGRTNHCGAHDNKDRDCRKKKRPATSHNTDPGFADAANGDFTVAASSQQAKFQIGDSRWLVEYVPEDITAEKALLAEEIAKATALLGDVLA